MHYFFYLSWLAQLIVGVGLLIISLLVHYSVIASLLNSSVVTFLLAAMLVTARINTIIWHRYFLCGNGFAKSQRASKNWPILAGGC